MTAPHAPVSPASPAPAVSPLSLLTLFAGVVLPLTVIGFIAEDVFEHERFVFESPLLLWVHAHSGPSLTGLSVFLNTFGGPPVMGALFVVIVLGLWQAGRRTQSLFALTGLGGAVGVAFLMKMIFHRARPELWPRLITENGASFPSGHATVAAALVTCIAVLLWPTRWRWPVLILGTLYALTVGFSRLVLGVHYPTDVLTGWLTGLSMVLGAAAVWGRPGFADRWTWLRR